MKRKHLTGKKRLEIFEREKGLCEFCGGKIDGTRERWEISHSIALALGGEDEDSNLHIAHHRCHRDWTAEKDIPAIAKSNRLRLKNYGAKAPSKRPLPGGRLSRWKKKVSGEVVRRVDNRRT